MDDRKLIVDTSAIKKAYFIKLGEGGRITEGNNPISFDEYCINNGIAYFGFGSNAFIGDFREGNFSHFEKHMRGRANKRAATTAINIAKAFFGSDEKCVWFTFFDRKFYWALLEGDPYIDQSQEILCRRTKFGWRSTAATGGPELSRDAIPGSVAKIAGYRGTICSAGEATNSVLNLIRGRRSEGAERAEKQFEAMIEPLLSAIRELNDKDFEVLVDLILTNWRWQRQAKIGGVEKDVDGVYKVPVFDFDIAIQTKTKTSFSEFSSYVSDPAINPCPDNGSYDPNYHFFYFFNQSDDQEKIYQNVVGMRNVHVIGPKEIPKLVLDAGLVNWVTDHAR